MGLIDADGLGALSMRRLANAMGVGTMSLYRYFPDKETLLDGVAELLLAGIEMPPHGDEPWQTKVEQILVAYRRLAQDHPNAFQLPATRPLNTLGALRHVEAFLEILVTAGLSDILAQRAVRIAGTFSSGYLLNELAGLNLQPHRSADSSALSVEDLPEQGFPRLRIAASQPWPDPEEEYALIVSAVITAIEDLFA